MLPITLEKSCRALAYEFQEESVLTKISADIFNDTFLHSIIKQVVAINC